MLTYTNHKELAAGQGPLATGGRLEQRPPDPRVLLHDLPQRAEELQPRLPPALFQLQPGTTQSDPYPGTPPERCTSGSSRTSQHLLVECPDLDAARNNLLSPQDSRIPLTPPNRPRQTKTSASI